MKVRDNLEAEYLQHLAMLKSGDELHRQVAEMVEWWSSHLDPILDQFSPQDLGEHFPAAVRGFWEGIYNDEVRPTLFVDSGVLVEVLALFVTYWKHGETLARTLTIFERAVLDANILSKIKAQEESAKQFSKPTLAVDTAT